MHILSVSETNICTYFAACTPLQSSGKIKQKSRAKATVETRIIGWPLGPDLSGKSNSNGNLGRRVSVT